MTFAQLTAMKAWMVAHRAVQPIEYHSFDAVLTLWLVGWMGAPAFIVLDAPWAVIGCVVLFFTPGAYLRLRRSLHLKRRLRCDWLEAVWQPARA